MFEKYKKGIKNYDFQLRIDIVFKIVFVIMVIIAALIIHYSDLHYILKLLIILGIEVFAIIIGLSIIFLWNVYNRFKTNEKNPFKRFKFFIKTEDNKRSNFVIELLKEFNINSPEKIIYMTNFYKDKYQKFTFSQPQSIFGLFVIFMGLAPEFYNIATNGIDNGKFSFSIGLTFVAIMVYEILVFMKYVFKKILFSSKYDIYEKFMNTLNYFYLNYEEYENELKNNVK